MTVKVKQAAN